MGTGWMGGPHTWHLGHSGLTPTPTPPGLQRAGHRWGNAAPADRGAPADHHGSEAGACSQDPGPGEWPWAGSRGQWSPPGPPWLQAPPRPTSLQVAKRLGRVFYMASFPVALPLQPPTLRVPERDLTSGEQPLSPATARSPYAGRASPKQENGTMALLPGPADPSQPLC